MGEQEDLLSINCDRVTKQWWQKLRESGFFLCDLTFVRHLLTQEDTRQKTNFVQFSPADSGFNYGRNKTSRPADEDVILEIPVTKQVDKSTTEDSMSFVYDCVKVELNVEGGKTYKPKAREDGPEDDDNSNSKSSEGGAPAYTGPLVQCEECLKMFSTKVALKIHRQVDHRNLARMKAACAFCRVVKFFSKAKLSKHERRCEDNPHPGREAFHCVQCTKAFTDKAALQSHVTKVHRHIGLDVDAMTETKNSCGRLKKQTKNNKNDNNDGGGEAATENEDPKKRLACRHCSKRFFRMGRLVRHLANFHNERDGQCEFCNVVFITQSRLRFHRIRCKKNPDKIEDETTQEHKCDECGVTCSDRKTYKKHYELEHPDKVLPTEEKSSCPYCAKVYNRPSYRYSHESECSLNPGRLLEHQCHLCRHVCLDADELNQHYPAEHTGEKMPFECKFCHLGFVLYTKHKTHQYYCTLKNSWNIVQCEMCDEKFKWHSQLKEHMQMKHTSGRNFACQFCAKMFATRSLVHKHERYCPLSGNQVKFPCPHCSKIFTNKSNQNKHVELIHGSREFKSLCQYCGKGFMVRGDQKKHVEYCTLNPNRTNAPYQRKRTPKKKQPAPVVDADASSSSVAPVAPPPPQVKQSCEVSEQINNLVRFYSGISPFDLTGMSSKTKDRYYDKQHHHHDAIAMTTSANAGGVHHDNNTNSSHVHNAVNWGGAIGEPIDNCFLPLDTRPYECLFCHDRFRIYADCKRHITCYHGVSAPSSRTHYRLYSNDR